MKRKHRQHMAGLEEKMAEEYADEKEQERIRMEQLAESLRNSHEEEMTRLTKVAEKENQELEEQNRRLLEEREKMRVEQVLHFLKTNFLSNQLAAAMQELKKIDHFVL